LGNCEVDIAVGDLVLVNTGGVEVTGEISAKGSSGGDKTCFCGDDVENGSSNEASLGFVTITEANPDPKGSSSAVTFDELGNTLFGVANTSSNPFVTGLTSFFSADDVHAATSEKST
jgi:hypothetical protein